MREATLHLTDQQAMRPRRELRDDAVLAPLVFEAFALTVDEVAPQTKTEKLVDYAQFLIKTYPEALAVGTIGASIVTVQLVKALLGALTTVTIVGGVSLVVANQVALMDDAPLSQVATPEQTSPAVQTYTFAPSFASINFEGTESGAHVNPRSARAEVSEGVLTQWAVYHSGTQRSDLPLIAGSGDTTDNSLAGLQPGSYFIAWQVEDENGAVATIQREFIVR